MLPRGVSQKHGLKGMVLFMNTASFIRGLAAGAAVGAVITMICDPITDKQRHKLQKKTEGVFKSIGGVIDTAIDIKNGMF